MGKRDHIKRMIIGFVLYWIVSRCMPTSWWLTEKGWFWWTVPYLGYYAYHPTCLKWHEPVEMNKQCQVDPF